MLVLSFFCRDIASTIAHSVSLTSDRGTPIVLSKPDSPIGKIYRQIAENIHRGIQEEEAKNARSQSQTKFVIE
jgi:MinD-like ATPase involved in chromosome partitioning or flagellar assembly